MQTIINFEGEAAASSDLRPLGQMPLLAKWRDPWIVAARVVVPIAFASWRIDLGVNLTPNGETMVVANVTSSATGVLLPTVDPLGRTEEWREQMRSPGVPLRDLACDAGPRWLDSIWLRMVVDKGAHAGAWPVTIQFTVVEFLDVRSTP